MKSIWKYFCTAFVLLALIAAGRWWFFGEMLNSRNHSLTRREIATWGLAAYLSEHYPGKKVVVAANPFTQKKGQPPEIYRYESAGIRGIQAGLKDKSAFRGVEYPELRPQWLTHPESVWINPKSTTPLSYLVDDQAFDKIMDKHPEAGILISLIGLPAQITSSKTWIKGITPIALLLPDFSVLGPPETVQAAFKSGRISAAVINKPGAPV